MFKPEPEQIKKLSEPFPAVALSPIEGSKGKDGQPLTSIGAYYIIKRLNDVFGLGGWQYVYTPIQEIDLGERKNKWDNVEKIKEFITDVTITLFDKNGNTLNITSPGGHTQFGIFGTTDSRKSAVTSGISKCASMLGIGQEIFMGLSSHDVKGVDKSSAPLTTTPFKSDYKEPQRVYGTCPDCGKEAIIDDKWVGGQICWKNPKAGGCGKRFIDPKIQTLPALQAYWNNLSGENQAKMGAAKDKRKSELTAKDSSAGAQAPPWEEVQKIAIATGDVFGADDLEAAIGLDHEGRKWKDLTANEQIAVYRHYKDILDAKDKAF